MTREASAEQLVKGFHGTSITAARAILSSGFKRSHNTYDWLGDGIYFFQDAPNRAREWASERYGNEATVIGAEIALGDCMDFLDTAWTRIMTRIYDRYLDYVKRAGITPPRQTSGAHRLDREVINYGVGVLRDQGINVSSVRTAFIEGQPVYPDSALYDRAHIQIAIRDTDRCIRRLWLERSATGG